MTAGKDKPPSGGEMGDWDMWEKLTGDPDMKPMPHVQPKQRPEPEIVRPQTPAADRVRPPPAPPAPLPRLEAGEVENVDAAQARRFRRGQIPIEAMLDLHGHDRDSARAAFVSFVQRSQAEGLRNVLVITGKGISHAQHIGDKPVGILRGMLPDWVNSDDVRPLVLAFTEAQREHGGDGAFYLLLKRNRREHERDEPERRR